MTLLWRYVLVFLLATAIGSIITFILGNLAGLGMAGRMILGFVMGGLWSLLLENLLIDSENF